MPLRLIEREGGPERSARDRQSWIGPRAASVPVLRHHVETPDEVPVTGIECVDVPGDADGISARVANVYPAIRGDRRHGDGDPGPCHLERAVPQHVAVCGIERDHMRIGSPPEEPPIEIGEAAIDRKAGRPGALVVAAPLLLAAGCIDRVGALEGREVHGAVDDERSGLKRGQLRQRERAAQRELPDIRGGDLRQRGIPITRERAVVRGPVSRLRRRRRGTRDSGAGGERRQRHGEPAMVVRHVRSNVYLNRSSTSLGGPPSTGLSQPCSNHFSQFSAQGRP